MILSSNVESNVLSGLEAAQNWISIYLTWGCRASEYRFVQRLTFNSWRLCKQQAESLSTSPWRTFSNTANGTKQHIVRSTYTPPVHAWTLRTLFRFTKYYNGTGARGMLSTVTLPLIDLTLQVEFNTLIPVWSHSQTTKPRILKRHLLGIDYITYQGLVGKVDSITPNPKLKSVLRTFGEAHSIRRWRAFSFWNTPSWHAGPGQESVMV